MKLPLSWLKDYVDVNVEPEVLKDKLFSCGFEVEELIYLGKNLNKVVACRILSMEKHPNADKLAVCQVDAGEYGNPLQIVTGAKNVNVGDLVAIAMDGATLATGDKIVSSALRGVDSFGMMCGAEEIGITEVDYDGADGKGVLVFNEEYPTGTDVKEILGLNDVIFDISVTANRPDCQSILGLAREVAAVLGLPLKMPSFEYKTVNDYKTTSLVDISVTDSDICPRYMAQAVKNVKIEESPKWIKDRLRRVGIRPISNIVDITNFVLMEIGQPMHAFDYDNLEESKIIVRRAKNKETIKTLDEKDYSLDETMLVICDGKKPVGIAGIMGGYNSEIKDSTTQIVFESAKFTKDSIRKTSRKLGKRSDSSARYEKGVYNCFNKMALNRALHLIDELNAGEIACDGYDILNEELFERKISCNVKEINDIFGIVVETSKIVEILKKLEFIVEQNGDEIVVKVPAWREDVEGVQDLAEEVIRMYGYDNIEGTLLKDANMTFGGLTLEQKTHNNLKSRLVSSGFYECMCYSFTPAYFDRIGLDNNDAIKVLNPIDETMNTMRLSLLPSMIDTISLNLKRKNEEGRLFELARVYLPKSLPLQDNPTEDTMLSLGMFGENEDFFTMKGVIENIADLYGARIRFIKDETSYMHPGRSAGVYVGKDKIGEIGQLLPAVAEKFEIEKEVYVGELNLTKLSRYYQGKFVYKPISKYPRIDRDLAFLVGDDVTSGELVTAIKKSGGNYLVDVSLFDIYKGEQLPEGKKSLAYALKFVAIDRTLSAEEIDESVNKIIKTLKDKFNVDLR